MAKLYKYKCRYCDQVFYRSVKAAWFLSLCGDVKRVVRVYVMHRPKKKVKGK
jgi:hypothetical protein